MGGNPGSSARCIQCRRRRRKCDLGRPCSRCVKSGTTCSGPVESTVYVNLNASTMHKQTHRKNLHAAFATRSQPHGNHRDLVEEESDLRDVAGTTKLALHPHVVSNHPMKTISILTLYTFLMDEFKPKLSLGIFSGDRLRRGRPLYSSVATGIRSLLPFASHSNRTLDLSLFTLLTRYFGAFREDQKLIDLARSSYTMVLGESYKHMHSMEHMLHHNAHADDVSRALACLCLALLLFEMVDQPASKEACEVHIDGALKVLQITGPVMYQRHEGLQYAFSSLRGLVIPVALRRRQRIFLADNGWLDLPFTIVGKTKLAKLHDLAIHLPGLMERTDTITKSYTQNPMASSQAIELKKEYLSLREGFIDWFNHVMIDDHGPIYWYNSKQPYIKSEEDPICVPHLSDGKHSISFRDSPRAGLLAHYWSFRLELIMGLLDLYKVEADKHNQFLDLVPGLNIASCLHEANTLAQLILEAIPYLSSCLEGRIVMQGPLETLDRYHERLELGYVVSLEGDFLIHFADESPYGSANLPSSNSVNFLATLRTARKAMSHLQNTWTSDTEIEPQKVESQER